MSQRRIIRQPRSQNRRLKSSMWRLRPVIECLEDRRLLAGDGPPQIIANVPSFEHVLAPQVFPNIQIEFDEEIDATDLRSKVELLRPGNDLKFDTPDDRTDSLQFSYEERVLTINRQLSEPGQYRLTVFDTLTDLDQDSLDGDGDGVAGGDWVREFIVGNPPPIESVLLGDPAGPQAQSYFGEIVAGNEQYLVISAAEEDDSSRTQAGVYYVFDSQTNVMLHRIVSPDSRPGERAEARVAVGGDLLFIKPNERGTVYVYDALSGEIQYSIPPRTGVMSGAISVHGNVLAIADSEQSVNGSQPGVVHLYDAQSGTFRETISNPSPHSGSGFGSSIVVSNDFLVIGNPGNQTSSSLSSAGSVHVYDAETLQLLTTFEETTPAASNRFGGALAIEGSTLVVGATGVQVNGSSEAGSVFQYDLSDNSFVWQIETPAPGFRSRFGMSIAIDDGAILVGSPGPTQGHVFVYDSVSGDLIRQLDNPSGPDAQGFGQALFASDGNVTVGRVANTPDSVFVIDIETGLVEQEIEDLSRATNEQLGVAIAVSADYVVASSVNQGPEVVSREWLTIFDTQTGQRLRQVRHPLGPSRIATVRSLELTGNIIVAGDPEHTGDFFESGIIYLINADSGIVSGTIESPFPAVNANFGSTLAVGGDVVAVLDRGEEPDTVAVHLFDVNTGLQTRSIDLDPGVGVEGPIDIHIDGDSLLVAYGKLEAFNVNSGNQMYSVDLPGVANATSRSVVGDGTHIVVVDKPSLAGGGASDLRPVGWVYDFDTGSFVSSFEFSAVDLAETEAPSVAIDDGVVFLTRSVFGDNSILVIDAESGELRTVVSLPALNSPDNFGASIGVLDGVLYSTFPGDDTQNMNQGAIYTYDFRSPFEVVLMEPGVVENSPAGTAAGQLNVNAFNPAGPYIYTLVSGEGDDDNDSIEINGDMVRTLRPFDFESQEGIFARIRVEDSLGRSRETEVVFPVTDFDEVPPQITGVSAELETGFSRAGSTFLAFNTSERLDNLLEPGGIELFAAGGDGLVGTEDDVPIDVSVSQSGFSSNQVRVRFDPLTEGGYRFTVSNQLHDAAGNALEINEGDLQVDTFVRDIRVQPGFEEFVDPVSDSESFFGVSIEFGDDYLAIASLPTPHPDVEGRVAIFDEVSSQFKRTISSPLPDRGNQFGSHLSSFGDNLLVSDMPYFSRSAVSAPAFSHIFNADTGDLLHTLSVPTDGEIRVVFDVALSDDFAAVGSYDRDDFSFSRGFPPGRIDLFDRLSGELVRTIEEIDPDTLISSGQIQFAGNMLVSTFAEAFQRNPGVALIDPSTGEIERKFRNPETSISSLSRFGSQFAIDGNQLVVGDPSNNAPIRLFDVGTGDLIRDFNGAAINNVQGVSVRALGIQGDTVIVGSTENSSAGISRNVVKVFDATTGQQTGAFGLASTTAFESFGAITAMKGATVATRSSASSAAGSVLLRNIGQTGLDAADDFYQVLENDRLVVPVAGLLFNDIATSIGPIAVDVNPVAGPSNGVVSLSPDGSFVYTPNPGFSGQDSFVYRTMTSSAFDTATVTIDVANRPSIASIVIGDRVVGNDVDVRASVVDQIHIQFDALAIFEADAFTLINSGGPDGSVVPVDVSISQTTEGSLATLSFSDLSDGSISDFGSLNDGQYQVLIHTDRVTDLEGNPIELSNETSVPAVDRFYAKYGDFDGSGSVGLSDFAIFRGQFGLTDQDERFLNSLDFDRDGQIGLSDFAAFRGRFGT